MKVDELSPSVESQETFKRHREKYVPSNSGCYALTNFGLEVLYVGMAKDLRKKFSQHLDSPEKTRETELGRIIFFHWLILPPHEVEKIERTWLNMHVARHGKYPILNKLSSPVYT